MFFCLNHPCIFIFWPSTTNCTVSLQVILSCLCLIVLTDPDEVSAKHKSTCPGSHKDLPCSCWLNHGSNRTTRIARWKWCPILGQPKPRFPCGRACWWCHFERSALAVMAQILLTEDWARRQLPWWMGWKLSQLSTALLGKLQFLVSCDTKSTSWARGRCLGGTCEGTS